MSRPPMPLPFLLHDEEPKRSPWRKREQRSLIQATAGCLRELLVYVAVVALGALAVTAMVTGWPR